MPQVETVDWTFPVTVEDVVLMGRIRRMGLLPWPSREDRRAAEAILERLGLAGSGGGTSATSPAGSSSGSSWRGR